MGDSPTWSPQQRARLAEWGVDRCVDVHCHCLPGLDDGPARLDDALELCAALVDDGVTSVVATPHQLGGYDRDNSPQRVRAAVAALADALVARGIPLEVAPGGDVRIDERLAELVAADQASTVADLRRHLLLELPFDLYVDPLSAIQSLAERGMQAILTHPERHRYLTGQTDRIASWVEAGAAVQLTAGSLLGDFGARANDEAWRLVHAGLATIVASDAHDAAARPPCLSEALDLLAETVGPAAARALCLDNPLSVWRGEPVAPVRPGAMT